jgi:poly(3-hydroxybutyrate) depolymerase
MMTSYRIMEKAVLAAMHADKISTRVVAEGDADYHVDDKVRTVFFCKPSNFTPEYGILVSLHGSRQSHPARVYATETAAPQLPLLPH